MKKTKIKLDNDLFIIFNIHQLDYEKNCIDMIHDLILLIHIHYSKGFKVLLKYIYIYIYICVFKKKMCF